MSAQASAKPNQGIQKKEKKQTVVSPFDVMPMQTGNDVVQRKAPCACGGGCPVCKAKSNDVKVSEPSDPAELEADHIAEKVMRMPAQENPEENGSKTAGIQNHTLNSIQRKSDTYDEENETKIQRKPLPSSAGGVPSQSPDHVSSAISSGGRPLDNESRNFFEPRLDHDLSAVRIHTDSTAGESARAIDAKAYTIGNNIVFGKGEYQPESGSGKHLLAHELAHVTQSANGSAQINRNVIYRTPVPNGPRELQGLPKEGISLKSTPENKEGNNLPSSALAENGDKVVVKNNNVQKMISIKSGTWVWIDVPGKTSPQPDYPVMHGFIEAKYLSAAPKAAPVSTPPPGPIFTPDANTCTQQPGQPSVEPDESNSCTQQPALPFAEPEQDSEDDPNQEPQVGMNPLFLDDKVLEKKINAMRNWLSGHSDAKMTATMEEYEAEAHRRIEAERLAHEKSIAPAAAVPEEPQEDLGELESALSTLKTGIYVSQISQGASGASAEGPTDRAKYALSRVDEKFLVPETDEMDAVARLNASIADVEARIEKQKKFVSNWSTETKLSKAVESAMGQIGGELGERLKELLTPESIAIMAAFAVAYVVSQTTPIGWVADILIVGMIAATILMIGSEAIQIVKLLIEFVDKAENAKSQADIDAAGKALATAITKAGVDIILAILLHKAGKSANLKPPGPRSPGIVEVMKTGGEKVMTTITEPATNGSMITPEGISPWECNMSMMEGPPASGPKSSGGSGKGSGTPKTGGEPAKPPTGQGASAGIGLPKKPVADAIKGKKSPVETEPGKSPAADEPGKSKPAEKPADTPAKDAAPSKAAPAKVDPQQGVKSALERIDKKIADAKTEMAEKGKEVTKLSQEEWALKQKIKETSSSDPGRAQMLEELKAKQEKLKELKEQQEHRKSLNDQDLETRTRLKNALEAKTYERPGFTQAERAAIWEQAKTEGGGKVTSPSGVEIKPGDPWDVGHKPKYEHWKHVRSAAERGISREQFLRECKDLKKYRPETPKDNSSHLFEDKTDAYLGE